MNINKLLPYSRFYSNTKSLMADTVGYNNLFESRNYLFKSRPEIPVL